MHAQGQGHRGESAAPLFDSSTGDVEASPPPAAQPIETPEQNVNSSSSSGLLSFIGRGLGWGSSRS